MVVVFALGRLNHYTQGFRTKVETDQEPLTSIWKKPVSSTSARVQRLLLRLLKYDIGLQYIPGKRSVIAHALSRVSHFHSSLQISRLSIVLQVMNFQSMFQPHQQDYKSTKTPHRMTQLCSCSHSTHTRAGQSLARTVHMNC